MARRKRSTRTVLRALFYAAKGICTYCKRSTEMPSMLPRTKHWLTATIDHSVPISREGSYEPDNLVLACHACNNMKADLLPEEWKAFMAQNPQWWLLSTPINHKPLSIEDTQMILKYGKDTWRNLRRNGDVTYTPEGYPIVPYCRPH